jgi:preprotein translocase subunit YajC
MGLLLIPLILVVMYLLLLRPQQQRVRRQRELVMSIDVGDEIVTAGGMIGRVVELSDDRAWIEVADDVVIEILRVAISRKTDSPRLTDDGAEDDGEEDAPRADGSELGRDHVEDEPHDHSDGGAH